MLMTLFLIGLFSGIVTGLLSIGGGIILIFALLIIPPLILHTHFSMHTIAGFSIIQAFFTSLSGGYFYIRKQLVDKTITFTIGFPALFGGMVGVLLANHISDLFLRIIFASFAGISAIVMQIPYRTNDTEDSFTFTTKSTAFTVLTGLVIGVMGGLVGLSAGFVFVPLLIFFFKLPIKKAIGSSLLICFLLSVGSLIIKLSSGAFPLSSAILLVVGGIIGAQIGGRITKKLNSITLKRIAAYSILLVSIKLFYDLVF